MACTSGETLANDAPLNSTRGAESSSGDRLFGPRVRMVNRSLTVDLQFPRLSQIYRFALPACCCVACRQLRSATSAGAGRGGHGCDTVLLFGPVAVRGSSNTSLPHLKGSPLVLQPFLVGLLECHLTCCPGKSTTLGSVLGQSIECLLLFRYSGELCMNGGERFSVTCRRRGTPAAVCQIRVRRPRRRLPPPPGLSGSSFLRPCRR